MSAAQQPRRRLADEETGFAEAVRAMFVNGASIEEIASTHGRSPQAVTAALRRWVAEAPVTARRPRKQPMEFRLEWTRPHWRDGARGQRLVQHRSKAHDHAVGLAGDGAEVNVSVRVVGDWVPVAVEALEDPALVRRSANGSVNER